MLNPRALLSDHRKQALDEAIGKQAVRELTPMQPSDVFTRPAPTLVDLRNTVGFAPIRRSPQASRNSSIGRVWHGA
jgi:hypothetical protein